MPSPFVAVVILNYNGKKYLNQFLPSVYQTTYSNYVLYVVDNGSTDDSVAYLQEQEHFQLHDSSPAQASEKRLLTLPTNYGFAEGYNVALKQIQADYYVLLNSDVEVTPNWLEPLVACLQENAQIAACQPKIRMFAQKQLFEHAGAAGGMMDKWGYPFCRGRVFDTLEQDAGQFDDAIEVFWATGAALCVRANLYHELGGLDGDFFAHMEEIDFCWRAKRANYGICYCPESLVYHVGGGTLPVENPRKTYLNFRNSLAMLVKNVGAGWVFWLVWVRLVLDGVAGFRFLLKGDFKNLWAIVQAHWAFFLSIPTLLRKRKAIKRLLPKVAYQQNVQFNSVGILRKSIVWAYFIQKKKTYKDLIK